MRLRVVDLDGALTIQPYLAGLIASGEAERIDARDLAPRAQDPGLAPAPCASWASVWAAATADGEPEMLFFGSGDFHHLTALIVARHAGPLTIVHFDNHPDWVRYPTINCGSWVNHGARLAGCRPSRDDRPVQRRSATSRMEIRQSAGDPRGAAPSLSMAQSVPTRLWGAPVMDRAPARAAAG